MLLSISLARIFGAGVSPGNNINVTKNWKDVKWKDPIVFEES